jgi:hypothetical protein
LPADLRRDVVVGQARGGEEGDLLAAGDGVHDVDGGDAGLDHLLGVGALRGVDGRAVDVQELLGKHGGAAGGGRGQAGRQEGRKKERRELKERAWKGEESRVVGAIRRREALGCSSTSPHMRRLGAA